MGAKKRKIVVAITGASGSIYASTLLNELSKLEASVEVVAVIFSENAKSIWSDELGSSFLPTTRIKEFENNNFYLPFASGSSDYDTMIICPASMGILGRIANGISDDLITRTADVMLKERRRLLLVPREMPFNLIHLRNMETLTLAGAIVSCASPSFYSKPATLNDMAMTVVERILSLVGLEREGSFKWCGDGR